MHAQDLARIACSQAIDPQHLAELRWRCAQDSESHFGVKEGVDPKELGQTGWGVIFARGADPAVYEALSPLLQLRKRQTGLKQESLYREFRDADGYRPSETKLDFLMRHGAGPGPVNPEKVPYYLLIVGDPDSIPFRFQYQLDVQYAVGRICFDTTQEYEAYALSVVAAETVGLALPKRAAVFGVANEGDFPTQLSQKELAQPLAEWAAAQSPWAVEKYLGDQATKERLTSLLGEDAPALLFTASHGMCYPSGDSRQFPHQGALLCQDWPGPSWKERIPDRFYFSGDDVSGDAHVHGLIAMYFACFGAGTPRWSDFSNDGATEELAPYGFIGRLPQRLLAHTRGGALAVIGHVERSWGCSFHWDRAGRQTQVFESTLKRLMEGHPVGSALEYFNGRYAELSSDLSTALEDVKYGKTVDEYLISGMWTANNDARSYTVIGDPAVRLMLAEISQPLNRPSGEVIAVSATPPQMVTSAVPPASSPPASAPMTDDGLVDDTLTSVASSLQKAAEDIGKWLANTFESMTSVHVATYVSDNLAEVKYQGGVFAGARLRAVTQAGIDGNTLVCVPEQDGKVDDILWKIHSDIVEKALANRVEMLRTAALVASSLVPREKVR
jgi:hypothetical protein